jgi:hypothetical protein
MRRTRPPDDNFDMDRCDGTCGCLGCEDCAVMVQELAEDILCGECGHVVAEREVAR